MKNFKPDTYTETKKVICDWSDKNNYFIHYRMLTIYVRHGMIVDKDHEILSFKPSKWLVNMKILIHERETGLKMILKKTSINY